jgi:hypothetical protein
VPGIHAEGTGAAAMNPFGAEWLQKTESATGESEAGAWARRYCPGAWNQFGRAGDAGGAIQKNFFDDAFVVFHWKNVNMLRGRKASAVIIIKIMFGGTMNISSLIQGIASFAWIGVIGIFVAISMRTSRKQPVGGLSTAASFCSLQQCC